MSEESDSISGPERPIYPPEVEAKRSGLQIFGWKLRLASGKYDINVFNHTHIFSQNSYKFFWFPDDFVLPAFIACLSHACYLIATSAIYAYSSQIILTGSSCLDKHNLNIYVRLLTFFLPFTLLELCLETIKITLYIVVSNCNQLHDSSSYTLPNSRHSFCKRHNLG